MGGFDLGYLRGVSVWPQGPTNQWGNLPYTQGSLDCEYAMQHLAVKFGAAHWEYDGPRENGDGVLFQYFVWDGDPLKQQFRRIPENPECKWR